ncbi:hypothetical protein [Chitinophaga deserti]|uniref:hypothetical protein n=1 Tax=Chitinophaga deserti TaxID=2164099 RepID=UPI000D6B70CC|nr:hypothetical protein [Chitinophaga deserti]
MKYPLFLTNEQVKQLEFELLSDDFYINLTRQLLHWTEDVSDHESIITRKNRLINLSRLMTGKPIYRLESDDMGGYEPAEFAWHDSNFFLILRELNIVQFIEYACELIGNGILKMTYVNLMLQEDGASFKFTHPRGGKLSIEVLTIEEIESTPTSGHPNIRLLVNRMDHSLAQEDYASVLHASASIFETMAKDIVRSPAVQNQTLGSFFLKYKQESALPEEVLNYILDIYKSRNTEPLAGHGSTTEPKITREQAIILTEITKAFVRIEYTLQRLTKALL